MFLKYTLLGVFCAASLSFGFQQHEGKLIFNENDGEIFSLQPQLPENELLDSWMTCFWLKVQLPNRQETDGSHHFDLLSFVEDDSEILRLSLELRTSHLKLFAKNTLVTDVKIDRLTDGKNHYVCYAWRSVKNIWKVLIDGKEFMAGSLEQIDPITKDLKTKTKTGVIRIGDRTSQEKTKVTNKEEHHIVDKYQLEMSNIIIYYIQATKEILLLAQPDILMSKNEDMKYFRLVMVNIISGENSNEKNSPEKVSSSSSEAEDKLSDKENSSTGSDKSTIDKDVEDIRKLLRKQLITMDVQVRLFAIYNKDEQTDSSESSESTEKSCVVLHRQTRSENSVPKVSDKDGDIMLSDQPRSPPKEVVEETVNKKKASKDEFALSDILNDGYVNKLKDFGSKYDPSFSSKIDSILNRNGGGGSSPAAGNSGSMGGLGGLGGFSGLGSLGGFGGGGGSGGSPNFGSLASSVLGGGGTGGFNVNQFLGSNGLSNFFKKGGDKSPPNPSYPTNPSYPSNPGNTNYPSVNPANPPAYNPNYPPPPNSGSLYPSLPTNTQPAVPLSINNNNNNRGSVGLSDMFGGVGGLGTRGTDVAKPNNGPGYDISFGEIFGFGGSKKKDQNPNYPENNHKPTSGGVSLKDILGFGTKTDESKNSYVPNYGTIGGRVEPSKTRPKNNFDEISEGLGLNVDPDPIVRNNKPIIELNQPNQSSKSSLSESMYRPRDSSTLMSQRTNSNTYASRRPPSGSSYSAQDAQRAVEEQIIQSTKVQRGRRDLSSRESAKLRYKEIAV